MRAEKATKREKGKIEEKRGRKLERRDRQRGDKKGRKR
jgi:hypothetical protein